MTEFSNTEARGCNPLPQASGPSKEGEGLARSTTGERPCWAPSTRAGLAAGTAVGDSQHLADGGAREPDVSEGQYPVPGRTPLRNRQIAAHEVGHTFAARALGDFVHFVTVIPDRSPGGFEGRTVRSGPPSELTLTDCPEITTDQILSICERLERLTPEIGSSRMESAEFYQRALNNVIELVAGEAAETILRPDLPSLGALHDFTEADAFAKIAVVSQPAVATMIAYAKAEAQNLLTSNRDILSALVEALVEHGTLTGEQVDLIISNCITVRSMAAERERRADWKRRESNAATFKGE